MKQRVRIKEIFLLIFIGTLIVPVLIGCFYGSPSADDFTNSIGWIYYEGNHLKFMFENLVNIYQKWQGTYLGVFMAGFPIYYVLGIPGLRIWLFLVAIIFFISVFMFSNALVKWYEIDKEHSKLAALTVSAMFLFYVLCTNSLGEIFYWYTGTCVYTLPISFALYGFSFYVKYEKQHSKSSLVFSILFALGAAGGSLDIAALLCSILLLLTLYNFIVLRKIDKGCLVFLAALMGAIINVVAPGNFVRHSVIDSKIRPFSSIYHTIAHANKVISYEFQTGFLLVIIVVAFLFAFIAYKEGKKDYKYPGLVTLYGYLSIIITDFPVLLGYSGSVLPDRCSFVEHISIYFSFIFVSMYWASWAAQRKKLSITKELCLIVSLICIIPLSTYINFSSILTLTPYRMAMHIAKGNYQIAAEREALIISQISSSDESNVIVEINRPLAGEWTNIMSIGLAEDTNYWVNIGIADYYNKDTVSLHYID